MLTNIDKRARALAFRDRLDRAMREAGVTQSALARATGADRSTISQLLKGDGARLPNAHLVGACAAALGVSADWLLSLSDRPESAADLLAASMTITEATRAPVDRQILEWHREAAGYKMRHVPAALPDMLKTPEMLEWEYAPHIGRSAAQAIGASQDRLHLLRAAHSDVEMALPIYEVETFVRGQGYYRDLPAALRRAQTAHLISLLEALYPRLRVYLFDARRLFSAPLTIFGPMLAVLYVGEQYLAFRDTTRVQAFTGHFDRLVREADVTARALPARLRAWAEEIEG